MDSGRYVSAMPRIGVIGGGASAVCLLDALAQTQEMPPCTVMVFEPSRYLWRGRPYRPDLDVVRVNAVPEDMAVRAGERSHLSDWLAAREPCVGGATSFVDSTSGARFVSRSIYGDYLEQSARSALTSLTARSWRVVLVRDRVDRARRGRDSLLLSTARAESYRVDYAVLGVGAGEPADIYGLADASGFVSEPYPIASAVEGSRPGIDADSNVAVIGSGLTAVDVTLGLAHCGHRGQIRLHSRSGVLPGVRQRPVRHEPRHLTSRNLHDLAGGGYSVTLSGMCELVERELTDHGETLQPVETEMSSVATEEPVRRLRRNLSEVNSPSVALRILQQAVPEVGPDVYPLLPETDQVALFERYHRVLMSLCCPMPPDSAAALLKLIDRGQLEVIPGLENVARGNDDFVLESTSENHSANVVVNAVNARIGKRAAESGSLLGSLLEEGIAEQHPLGGLRVNRETSGLVTAAGADPRVYALGDTAVGSLYFTFGVESLVDRAVEIVEAIASNEQSDTAVWSCAPFDDDERESA